MVVSSMFKCEVTNSGGSYLIQLFMEMSTYRSALNMPWQLLRADHVMRAILLAVATMAWGRQPRLFNQV